MDGNGNMSWSTVMVHGHDHDGVGVGRGWRAGGRAAGDIEVTSRQIFFLPPK